jgi:hypothetical protein
MTATMPRPDFVETPETDPTFAASGATDAELEAARAEFEAAQAAHAAGDASDAELAAAEAALEASLATKQDAATGATDTELAEALGNILGPATPQLITGFNLPRQNTTDKRLLVVTHAGVVSRPGQNGHINFDLTPNEDDDPWEQPQVSFVACRNKKLAPPPSLFTSTSKTVGTAADSSTNINAGANVWRPITTQGTPGTPWTLAVPDSLVAYQIHLNIPALAQATVNRLTRVRITGGPGGLLPSGSSLSGVATLGQGVDVWLDVPAGSGARTFGVEIANIGGTGTAYIEPTATDPARLEAIFPQAGEIGSGASIWGIVPPGWWYRYRTSIPSGYQEPEFVSGTGYEWVAEVTG